MWINSAADARKKTEFEAASVDAASCHGQGLTEAG
jgi:hypothetical protein